jgi:hypothetical protein
MPEKSLVDSFQKLVDSYRAVIKMAIAALAPGKTQAERNKVKQQLEAYVAEADLGGGGDAPAHGDVGNQRRSVPKD